MVKVIVSTFAHSHALELEQMINSCSSSRYDVTYYLHLHSQYKAVVEVCERLAAREHVRYFPHGVNRGLAKSFNDTLLMAHAEGAQLVINSNDDSLWSEGDLDRLIETALDNPEAASVSCFGSHNGGALDSMGYCAIAFNWIAFDRVGMFDENFFPAYHEDVDHALRCRLAGLAHLGAEGTFVRHEGSGSIALNLELQQQIQHVCYPRNEAYYIRKWGGNTGRETYTTPFDCFPLYIPPEDRHAPYPGFNRDDQEIVQF